MWAQAIHSGVEASAIGRDRHAGLVILSVTSVMLSDQCWTRSLRRLHSWLKFCKASSQSNRRGLKGLLLLSQGGTSNLNWISSCHLIETIIVFLLSLPATEETKTGAYIHSPFCDSHKDSFPGTHDGERVYPEPRTMG